jgi:hypothetical protein
MTLINMVKYAWDLKMHGYPRDAGLVSQMHVTAHVSRNTECGSSYQNNVLRHLPACVESLDVMVADQEGQMVAERALSVVCE